MGFIELCNQFSPDDENSLYKLANYALMEKSVAIEVGSWCGHSSLILANIVKERKGMLYCIDRWDVYPDDETQLNPILRTKDVLSVFRANMKEAGVNEYVIPIVASSDEASKIIPDNFADIIFIDADHRYISTKKDILNYWSKLKIGGIMCGHDYDKWRDITEEEYENYSNEDYTFSMHIGLIRAVDEVFTNVLEIQRYPARIWAVEKGIGNL